MINIKNITCPHWQAFLQTELTKPYFMNLLSFLSEDYKRFAVYPKPDKIFKPLELTPYQHVKVVILGQDPYTQPGMTDGLAFSCNSWTKSLDNIKKELKRDLNQDLQSPNLDYWASQGVLLINKVTTVRRNVPMSHKSRGWEEFNTNILKSLSLRGDVVFLLWGSEAKALKKHIVKSDCVKVLEASHPSPRSFNKGFNGCGHFGAANEFLKSINLEEVKWG